MNPKTITVRTGGYTCPTCRNWVAPGTLHTCGYSTQPFPTTPQPQTWPPPQNYPTYQDPVQARIAAALERIADALEKAET